MIERDRDTNSDGMTDERLYVLQDANFNVTAIATTSGTIAERFQYDAYGIRTVLDSSWSGTSDAYGFLHGHQGGEIDNTTGFIHFRNRELSAMQMRWVQKDDLYREGLNLYGALGMNPVSSLDPEGRGFVPVPVPRPSLPIPTGYGDLVKYDVNMGSFYHYTYVESLGGANSLGGFSNGLRPGSFATPVGNFTGSQAKALCALPHEQPPTIRIKVTPEPGTPMRLIAEEVPKFGQPGGAPGVWFPEGTGPGTVSEPTPLPQRPPLLNRNFGAGFWLALPVIQEQFHIAADAVDKAKCPCNSEKTYWQLFKEAFKEYLDEQKFDEPFIFPGTPNPNFNPGRNGNRA